MSRSRYQQMRDALNDVELALNGLEIDSVSRLFEYADDSVMVKMPLGALRQLAGCYPELNRIINDTAFEKESTPSALSAGGDGHDSDCATHNEPAYPNGPCDCAGGDEAKKSEGGKHSPVKDEYLDGVMEKAKISPLIEYGTGWAKIHFKRELTDQDRENIVRALKTPSDPPDRCEIVARIIDPDAYEPINEARWEGLARLESQAEAQLSAECKARKILATLDGGR